jgi:hypothetical protein
MTVNVSAFGLSAQITADKTFPNGFTLTEFADDADPLDSPDFQASDASSGLNGDMLVWSKAGGIEVLVNVIPTSEGDNNLDALLDANRNGKNKSSAKDNIGIVFTYPTGQRVICADGVLLSGPMLPQVAGSGRLKTRQYRFKFEKVTKSKVTQ